MRDVIAHWRRPGCRFYLGCYEPAWLERTDVPLMLSYHRLKKRRRLPRAQGAWALDSGAYTHVAKYGAWRTSPPYYAGEVRRYRDEIGRLDYAAIQDWPCGDAALKASGLTIEDHIKRTVRNFLDLNMRATDVNWMPIIQGRTPEDYLRCIDLYYKCGVELHRWPLVGMGSVADRQTDPDVQQFIYWFSEDWPLHIFGASKPGLSRYSFWIAGADSMAWSYRARFAQCLGGCRVTKCNNCLRFALNWRAELLESIGFELVHGETPIEASQGESTYLIGSIDSPISPRTQIMTDCTPLSEYTDEELIEEVLRRELKLSDFGIALMKDDDKVLTQIREAMTKPWQRSPQNANE